MAFDRDLGYLWPFFDKVEAHAEENGLADLAGFIREERDRWTPVRDQLLGEATETVAPTPKPKPERPAYKPQPVSPPSMAKPQVDSKKPTGLTVGSLIDWK